MKYVTNKIVEDFLNKKGFVKPNVLNGFGTMIDDRQNVKNPNVSSFEFDDFNFRIHLAQKKSVYNQGSRTKNISYQFMDFVSESLIENGENTAPEYINGVIERLDKEIEERQKNISQAETEVEKRVCAFKLESAETAKTYFSEKYSDFLPSQEQE